MALHGLEKYLEEQVEKLSLKRKDGKKLSKRDKRRALSVIRYADDVRHLVRR